MKIGIDGSCLSNRRGFGRFRPAALRRAGTSSRRAINSRFSWIGPSAAQVEVPAPFDRVVVDVGEAPSRAASAQGRRRWRDMIAMGLAVARSGIDLMYFPATYSFFPVWNVPRLVVTMHDTLPLTHPELVFPSLSGRLAWRLKEAAAVALGRPDRDGLRGLAQGHPGLVGLARRADPRDHRRPRPDLPSPGRRSAGWRSSSSDLRSRRRLAICSMSAA